MSSKRSIILSMTVLTMLLLVLSSFTSVAKASEPSEITFQLVSPSGGNSANGTPTIIVSYYSSYGIENLSAIMYVDGYDVTYLGDTASNGTCITYVTPTDQSFLVLNNGVHNVTVSVTDNAGYTSQESWNITVGQSGISPGSIRTIIISGAIISAIGLASFVGYIIYLRKKKNFTFKKHFALHPIPEGRLVVVIPAIAASLFFILSYVLLFDNQSVTPFGYEYDVVISLFIGLMPYAIYAQKEKSKIFRYETAFSQFLFEMADAMRGGIDPAKAIVELSKTDTSVLSKHLLIAAKGIDMGRPFDEMVNVMVKPIKSKLIKRYASLIAESSKVGGEISMVVHRAAKDMDDLIKIDQERGRNLTMQATTIYIAFGVLLIIIYLLMTTYPSLGSMNLGSMFGGASGNGLSSTSTSTTSTGRMSLVTMKHRFMDLVLINGFGSGILIGLFTTGKVKYGLIHGLVMVSAAMVFFMVMIL